MFNDRDLGILGGGALLAVLCLFLPFSFAGRVVVGFLVLAGFMALALLRLGPDRVPPEVWLMRRYRYAVQTRRYVNQQAASRREAPPAPAASPQHESRSAQEAPPSVQRPDPPNPGRIPQPGAAAPQAILRPLDLAWNEVGIYPLLTALLGVVGVYFAVWLGSGGARELSLWFQ